MAEALVALFQPLDVLRLEREKRRLDRGKECRTGDEQEEERTDEDGHDQRHHNASRTWTPLKIKRCLSRTRPRK